MKTLKPIAERREVVVPARSVIDQVMDLPINSVVLIGGGLGTVAHRTGPDGWLFTRPPYPEGSDKPGAHPYYHNDEVRSALKRREGSGATFTVVREGGTL